jgi:DNA-binding NarL/FixJ family response regulator
MFILDMDIEQNAVGTIAQLRESAPTSKLVLLCGLEDQGRAREAIGAGVDGVILKIQPPEVVLAVIEALYATTRLRPSVDQVCAEIGRLGLSGQHTGKSASPPPAWPDALTEREREIIRLVEQGLSNKDIAHRLSISDSTVRHHMTNIFDKVGVSNRQKLLIHAHHFRSTPV